MLLDHQHHRGAAPAGLLVGQRREVGGRHALGQAEGQVAGLVSGPPQLHPGVHVLTDRHLREAARGHHGGAAVDQVGARADRRLVTVPGRLDEPEEDLLEGPGIALDVGERPVGDVEVLCRLDDADLGVREVGHGLVEELWAHREIGVDDRDEVPVADAEGVGEIAGLLHLARVGAHDVPEAVLLGQVAHLLPGRIIEDVDGLGPRPAHLAHVTEGVVQHRQRLAAAGQEHVHGLAVLPVAGHGGLVLGQGQPRAPDPQPEVDHDRRHHDHQQQPHERRDQPRRARPRGRTRTGPRPTR